MSISNFNVNLFPSSAMELIVKRVTDTSVTGKVVDTYIRKMDDKELIVLIMEKYYMRASRVTLTVTLDNFEGVTAVHIVSSGGAEGYLQSIGALEKVLLPLLKMRSCLTL